MTAQRVLEIALSPQPDRLFEITVLDSGTVQVEGISPREMTELLQAVGGRVMVGGGVAPQAAADFDEFGLSQRELDIVRLIGAGVNNNAVADRLFLSINTVKTYIRSSYRKLKISSRTQAVIWAIEHGLVPPRSQ